MNPQQISLNIQAFAGRTAEIVRLNDVLVDDLNAALDAHRISPEDQMLRRGFVRCFCAFLEAHGFGSRSLVLIFCDVARAVDRDQVVGPLVRAAFNASLELGEEFILREQSVRVSDKGEVERVNQYPKTEALTLFSHKIVIRILNSSYQIDPHGWGTLKNALRVRDRITHPRCAQSLEIENHEFQQILKAHQWYVKFARELHDEELNRLAFFKASLDSVKPC